MVAIFNLGQEIELCQCCWQFTLLENVELVLQDEYRSLRVLTVDGHATAPPQSPVSQAGPAPLAEAVPCALKEQFVLAQTRPFQSALTI